MSDISSISGSSSINENRTKIVTSNSNTDENLFLKLLVAQMTNQDPFNTQDPTQYVTQLAQFNMLEQTTNLNNNMKYLINVTNGLLVNLAMSSATSLIGKNVETYAPTDSGYDTTSTISGIVESTHIKDGVVYIDIRNLDTGKLISAEYESIIKVNSDNLN